MMRTYYSMLKERDQPDAVGKMKQFATYFTHGVRNGSKLRVEIYRTQDAEASWTKWMRFSKRNSQLCQHEKSSAVYRWRLHRQSRPRRLGLRSEVW